MGERRVLVIGSQCEELGHLDFLPKAAEELYAVMTDPERGACVSAPDLLIDPTVAQAKEAIKSAYWPCGEGQGDAVHRLHRAWRVAREQPRSLFDAAGRKNPA